MALNIFLSGDSLKKIARREYSMRVRGSTATAGFAGKKLMCLKAGCAFTAHTACDPISG